jgi:hypothetical protein
MIGFSNLYITFIYFIHGNGELGSEQNIRRRNAWKQIHSGDMKYVLPIANLAYLVLWSGGHNSTRSERYSKICK